MQLDELWPSLTGKHVLTIGYGTPLMPLLASKAAVVYAHVPTELGAASLVAEDIGAAVLVNSQKPLPEKSIDCIVALHMMEGVAETEAMLSDAWRVLKGNGSLLLIVPNRLGLWARNDRTPFGNGQPYSLAQIKKALETHEASLKKDQGFYVERVRYALFVPPGLARHNPKLAEKVERYAAHVFPCFGGVLLVEVKKQLCTRVVAKRRARQRATIVLPVPFATPVPT